MAVVVLTLDTLVVLVVDGAVAVEDPLCVPKVGAEYAVIEPDALEASELTPDPDCLTTVNVYAVPFVRPVMLIGLEDALPVIFPGDDVAT